MITPTGLRISSKLVASVASLALAACTSIPPSGSAKVTGDPSIRDAAGIASPSPIAAAGEARSEAPEQPEARTTTAAYRSDTLPEADAARGGAPDSGPIEGAADCLGKSSVQSLTAEVGRRLFERWEDLRHWVAPSSASSAAVEMIGVARQLLALSLIDESQDIDQNRSLLQSLQQYDSGVESRLIAAALLGSHGSVDERDALVAEVYEDIFGSRREIVRTPLSPLDMILKTDFADLPDLEGSDRFRLSEITFATEIRGLGDFKPRQRAEFLPGDETLIYGEFTNFQERTDREGSRALYHQTFRASLELLDGNGRSIKRQEFLNADTGSLRSTSSRSRINFWARYCFPRDLEPGPYTVVIEATDVESGDTADARLSLEILRRP